MFSQDQEPFCNQEYNPYFDSDPPDFFEDPELGPEKDFEPPPPTAPTVTTASPSYVPDPSAYRYPKPLPGFEKSLPPFPPPHQGMKAEPFLNTDHLDTMISLQTDLNEAYIAIPLPFWTRYREPKTNHSRPTFGYFIHK